MLQILQKTLLGMLNDVALCADKRKNGTAPFNRVRITASDNVVNVAGSNGDQVLQLTKKLTLGGATGLAVLAEIRAVIDAVKIFEKGDLLLLDVSKDDNGVSALTITSGQTITIPVLDIADDVIEVPAGIYTAEISPQQVRTVIDRLSWAVASYDYTSVLGGVFIEDDGKDFRACATDGSRMTTFDDDSFGGKNLLKDIVPALAWQVLDKLLLKNSDAMIEVIRAGQSLVFQFAEATLSTRVITGDYPRYRELFPIESLVHLEFDRLSMLKAAKTCAKLCERTHLMKVSCNGKCTVTSPNPDSKFATEVPYEPLCQIPAVDPHSQEYAFAVNAGYVADYLESSRDQRVRVSYQAPLKPLIFVDSNPKIKHLLMPVQAK